MFKDEVTALCGKPSNMTELLKLKGFQDHMYYTFNTAPRDCFVGATDLASNFLGRLDRCGFL
jgi:hypothetical protein